MSSSKHDMYALVPMPEYGWIAGKPLLSGRTAGIALMTYGKGRIQVGDEYFIDDSW